MFLHYLDQMPEISRRNCRLNNNQLQQMLMDFYESDKDCAMVAYGIEEYKNPASIYSGLRKGVKALEIPVDVRMIQGEVYLERID